ncbi:hypothetical protein NUU61_008088 [Penicillium alfredii]|uniref:Uncharacterized protein n=1 Tax=Penicillium alfredii TaxID=1506179 RepID=A0A9W9ERU0_9EURO|nr:uncharacterized protein NUU61_008088 [Penicillium alfredii]KAJ5086781.1 hypothetical protein NUU61_008088 [Penicillium alfredii]
MDPNDGPHVSWESLSSTFSHLEVSFSQDSCYGSDEVSVESASSTAAQSGVSNCVTKHTDPSLHPFLKSILKKPCTNVEHDTASESGYGSDEIESDYDALSDEEEDEDEDEDEDGDMSDFSVWDETSRDVPETHEDHTESFDDSFICFGPAVRFDNSVHYIDTSELDEDESSAPQMTCHEMMMRARLFGGANNISNQLDETDNDSDEDETRPQEFVRTTTNQPEDFARDAIDLDQRLFVAYMNGMHGVADDKYKPYLRTQVDHIRLGHKETMDPNEMPSLYLDLVLNHVIGLFRNLVAADELNELIALREEEQTIEQKSATLDLSLHQALLNKIEQVLLSRLTHGHVDVLPDELCFFAGGIVHALGTQDLPAQA